MQLSRMGVGAGFSDLVEGGNVGMGGAEDGDSSEEYDSDVETGGGKAEPKVWCNFHTHNYVRRLFVSLLC